MNKRRRMAIALGGALLVVIVGVGAYALWVADDSETLPDDDRSDRSSELQTFTDEENGFAISYPGNWAEGRARSGAADADFLATLPGTENAVSVSTVTVEEPVTINSRTSPELVAGVEDLLDRTIDDMPGVVELIQRRRIGVKDVQGWTYIYRFEDQAGRVGVHVKHFLFRGNNIYTLTFQAFPEENYGRLAEDFDRMLGSFEFLGPRDPEPATSVPDLEESTSND